MLTRLERRWLDYAWSVANCPVGHLQECEGALGRGPVRAPDARFPGNLGSGYAAERGVLFVGLVHRLRSAGTPGSTPEGVAGDALAEWLTVGRSETADEQYLGRSRAAYEAAIPEWSMWQNHFGPLADELRLTHRDVAYTNLAKCRADLDADPRLSSKLPRLCQHTYRIEDLARGIEAKAVLVATVDRAGASLDDLGREPDGPMVLRWDGRTRKLSDGRTQREWKPFECARIRRRLNE